VCRSTFMAMDSRALYCSPRCKETERKRRQRKAR
jgi:hypothetical protein